MLMGKVLRNCRFTCRLMTPLQTGAGGMAHNKRFKPRTETTNSHSRTMNIGRREKGRKTKQNLQNYNNIVASTDG